MRPGSKGIFSVIFIKNHNKKLEMFRRAVSTAMRQNKDRFTVKTVKRNMGGGPVPTEGFEGAIRKVLPKNEHVAMVSRHIIFISLIS